MSDFSFHRGDDIRMNFTFTLQDGITLVDLTGTTVFLTAKALLSDTDAAAPISQQWSTHTNPTQGMTALSLPHTLTLGITPAVYYYDLQIVDAGGNVTHSGGGRLTVQEIVTQRTA